MASRKQLMGMSESSLRQLGKDSGIHFEPGLSKAKMAIQIEAAQAFAWMQETTQSQHLASEFDDDVEGSFNQSGYAGRPEDSLSDAARLAQTLASSGYTETFHHYMSHGSQYHAESIHGFMDQYGVSADDVLMHLPRPNPEEPVRHFGNLKNYLNSHWNDYQDFMQPMAETHYSGDVMAEYSTNKGNVGDSYNHLAHYYLNKAAYDNQESYTTDVSKVASRLASAMKNQFLEVGYGAATGAKIGYHSILPQIGSDVINGTRHPRQPLNAAGLPLGSIGSAVGDNGRYSFLASVTGSPEWSTSDYSKFVKSDVSDSMRSLASSYKGGSDRGMNPYKVETSEQDTIMDIATRYISVEDARSGYANMDDDGQDIRYKLQGIIDNDYDRMDSQIQSTFNPVDRIRQTMGSYRPEETNGFTANFGLPTDYNSARARIESKRIADYDAAHANFRDVADGDSYNPVRFHNVEQGTQEWHDLRREYDITGSTVGAMLGNSEYNRPWQAMVDRIGLERGSKSRSNDFQERIFALGHQREEEARARVSARIGQPIEQAGAITNDNYPGMMYSPDGLIGDDALWEHKAPERANKYSDILGGEHKDYMDQIQMGMLLSGRKRTLFSQTIGSDTRDQWIDADPDWYENNKNRLDSIRGRLAAGRSYLEQNPGAVNDRERINGARAAMMGDGIWRDVKQGSDRGYSALAGSSSDPYIGAGGRTYQEVAQTNGYIPNFVTGAGNELMNVPQPEGADGAGTGMALAVKQGVLAAREEVKRAEGAAGAGKSIFDDDLPDADFDDLNHRPAGSLAQRLRNAFGGGGGNDGGNGGGNWAGDMFNGRGGGLAAGIVGGSLGSLQGGFKRELLNGGPIGQTIGLAMGAASIAGETISSMSDYLGNAQDFGSNNPYQFDAQQQGMEILGLNKDQAQRANQTVHSAYNRMANGDPSAAVQMSVATRGLITLGDVRASGGDPTKLGQLFADRARERGWSQERIAGAAEMAGLGGFARISSASYDQRTLANDLVSERGGENADVFANSVRRDNADRAYSSPDYYMQRMGGRHYDSLLGGAADGMRGAYERGEQLEGGINKVSDLINRTRELESNGRDYDENGNPLTSSTGAKYSMQVLPSTARDPGYGIKPAANDSPEEYNRVGRELLDKMVKRYDGNVDKAAAAYTDGAGTVDAAVSKYGADWLKHMPAQAQKRVSDLRTLSAGASRLAQEGSTGPSIGQVNVNVQATVNGKTASATSTVNGQSRSHTVNVQNGSVDQRR